MSITSFPINKIVNQKPLEQSRFQRLLIILTVGVTKAIKSLERTYKSIYIAADGDFYTTRIIGNVNFTIL